MSAWTDAGFPFGFRFRNPRDVFYSICCAMAERTTINSQTEDFYFENRRDEVFYKKNPPRPFQAKNYLNGYSTSNSETVFQFMKNRIMQIASCYCDPDKAYDFENYPNLENWTAESLEDKLKEKYVKFTPFCDREKYLLFIYHVLNLCTVKRAAVVPEYGCGKYRFAWGRNGDEYYNMNEAKNDIVKADFSLTDFGNPINAVSVYTKDNGYFTLYQYKPRFLSWIDENRPCDITFYGFASDYTVDEFYNFGADYIKRNKWFRVGETNITEEINGKLRVSRELDIPDSILPASIPVPDRHKSYKIGFSSGTDSYDMPYAYAVRDQRNYLKYVDNSMKY